MVMKPLISHAARNDPEPRARCRPTAPMQDDHHFDMQGHKDWGARVIMLMQSKGWWKW